MIKRNKVDVDSLIKILNSIPEILLFEMPNSIEEVSVVNGVCKGYKFIIENLGVEVSERDLVHLNTLVRNGFNTYTGFNPNPYRYSQAQISDFRKDPPNPMHIPVLMNRLLYLLSNESNLSPLEKAALAQGGIQHIQPFEDGNKRTGRLISEKILFENDFKAPLYDRRDNYITMLESVYNGISKLVKDSEHMEIFSPEIYKPLIDFFENSQ